MKINKKKAIEILEKYINQTPNKEHCLIVGYGMQALSKKLEKDKNKQEEWFIAGVLHDIDLETYNGDIKEHCVVGQKMLEKENVDKNIIETIISHNDALKIERNTNMKNALYCMDALSGIIRAYILMRPDKDISQLKTKSILKKIKDKTFARNVSREQIKLCETKLDLDLRTFIDIVVEELKDKQIF